MADLSIVLVDDHPIVRDGLCQVLAAAPHMTVVRACSTCGEAVGAVERHHPDILVLDASLPDGDGINAIPRILALSPKTGIVLFTATVNEERAVEALRLGAKAVLLKSTPADQLIETISAVADGGGWIAPDAGGRPVVAEVSAAIDRIALLTPREREIAERVATGARNKQIAGDLGLAEGTVKLHVSRAFRKLGVGNRVGLSRAVADR